jgi:putative ABC transport system substrate-binding protein
MKWIRKTIFTVVAFSCAMFAYADNVTVVYPNVPAPYDKIFDQILKGIEAEFDGQVYHYKLPSRFNSLEVSKDIVSDKVIALGKRGMSIAKQIYKEKPVVVGALPIKPNGISGVSLMADPAVLFESLNELAPEVKIVTVLYSQASAWVIEDALVKAKAKNLILKPIEVSDIKSAVKKYNELFEQHGSESMAIWLPLDPITANEQIIVPTILERAWKNKIVVFSSKPTHAKRGALFSALPDNELLGKQLAQLVNSFNYKKRPSTVDPLRSIKLAVNLRTAAHLGYDYQPKAVSQFALTFPN